MFDAGSPSETPLVRMRGRAEIGFARSDGADRLAHLFQQAPLRVLFPDPPEAEPPQAAIVTTSGGIAGGDRLELKIDVAEEARGLVLAQAAEKVYRSTGADAVVEVSVRAAPGAWAEYLPQETIIFDAARLRRITRLHRAPGASILAGEFLVLGRAAKGETVRTGLVRDAFEVRVGGRLAWADALHLDGDIAAQVDAAAGFGGARALATLILSADDGARHLDGVRALLADYAGRGGATVVNGQLVVRLLDDDGWRLRRTFATLWAELRAQAAGLAAQLPRLWHV